MTHTKHNIIKSVHFDKNDENNQGIIPIITPLRTIQSIELKSCNLTNPNNIRPQNGSDTFTISYDNNVSSNYVFPTLFRVSIVGVQWFNYNLTQTSYTDINEILIEICSAVTNFFQISFSYSITNNIITFSNIGLPMYLTPTDLTTLLGFPNQITSNTATNQYNIIPFTTPTTTPKFSLLNI